MSGRGRLQPRVDSDLDKDEFGRTERSNADNDDQSTIIDVVLSHADWITADKEGCLLGGTLQGVPKAKKKILDRRSGRTGGGQDKSKWETPVAPSAINAT